MSTTLGSETTWPLPWDDSEPNDGSSLADAPSAEPLAESVTTSMAIPSTTNPATSPFSADPAIWRPTVDSPLSVAPPAEVLPSGPKPYYQDSLVTIFLGDCRELLPSIEADVIVTDPPYGINFAGQPTKWQRRAGQAPERWDENPGDLSGFLTAAKWLCIWGGNYFDLPVSRGWLAWIKPDAPPSMGSMELAWTNLDRNTRHIFYSISATNAERVGHPTQKPLAVMLWTVAGMPPGTILDPFMGSGTTLVAAKSLNRRAIGIEIEERYCEMARWRCSQEVLGL